MLFAFPILLGALLAPATPTPAPAPTSTAPVYFGNPAVRLSVDARPLGVDPDGNARWLVVSKFFDAQNRPTRIMANSYLDWLSKGGYVQWQTRLRYGQPAAILKTHTDGPLTMTVRANTPKLGSVTVQTDPCPAPALAANALPPCSSAR